MMIETFPLIFCALGEGKVAFQFFFSKIPIFIYATSMSSGLFRLSFIEIGYTTLTSSPFSCDCYVTFETLSLLAIVMTLFFVPEMHECKHCVPATAAHSSDPARPLANEMISAICQINIIAVQTFPPHLD